MDIFSVNAYSDPEGHAQPSSPFTDEEAGVGRGGGIFPRSLTG